MQNCKNRGRKKRRKCCNTKRKKERHRQNCENRRKKKEAQAELREQKKKEIEVQVELREKERKKKKEKEPQGKKRSHLEILDLHPACIFSSPLRVLITNSRFTSQFELLGPKLR